MSKISFTNLYTAYVYFRHGISQNNSSGFFGKGLFYFYLPIDSVNHFLFGINLERLIAGRTLSIDKALFDLLDQGGKCLVIELGCGLQERSTRITKKYPGVRYLETDLEDVIAKKLRSHENITSQKCDITNFNDLRTIIDQKVESFDRTIVVAEGVLVYFTLEQLAPLFRRIAELQGKGSIILLYETYKIHKGMAYLIAKTFQSIVGWLTQSELDFLSNHRRLAEEFDAVPGLKVNSTTCMVQQKQVDIFVNTICAV